MGGFNVSPNVDMGEYLRRKRLMEPATQGPMQQAPPMQQDIQPPQQVPQAPQPMTTAADNYKNILAQAPQDDAYSKHTKMSRLVAALSGLSEGLAHGGAAGVKAAQNVLGKPLEDAKGTYREKLAGAEKAYQMENDMNAQQRAQHESLSKIDEYKSLANLHSVEAKNKEFDASPEGEERQKRIRQAGIKAPAPEKPWTDKVLSTDMQSGLINMQRQDGSIYSVPYKQPKIEKDPVAVFKEEHNFTHQLALDEIRTRDALIKARTKDVDKQMAPAAQEKAEKLAVMKMYRENPEYHKFIDPDTWTIIPGTRSEGKDIQNPLTWGNDSKGTFKAWEGKDKELFRKALSLHEKLSRGKNKRFSIAGDGGESDESDKSDYDIKEQ